LPASRRTHPSGHGPHYHTANCTVHWLVPLLGGVELNQEIQKGDKLMVMEAMKMQTTIYAPATGKVTEKLMNDGQSVEPKDLLVVISR